jgi:Thioesterase-like superfamily
MGEDAPPVPDAYYHPLDETHFASTPAVVGPWDAALSHGGPPAALLLHAVERALPRDDARVARISFDFLGPVPVADLEVTAERIRPGSRIELASARIAAAGRPAMVARAWRIATSPDRAPPRALPFVVPALPPEQEQRLFSEVPSFGYGESLEWRFVDGGFDQRGPATVWSRPRIPLLPGVPPSPLGRLLLMVDSANGISAELSPARFTFVPVELTVSVLRAPQTEWVGMRAETWLAPDGVGQTRAELFDEAGPLGLATQTLFVAPR